jgi:RNA polymerase sigma-70 factor (ECF subfamily)
MVYFRRSDVRARRTPAPTSALRVAGQPTLLHSTEQTPSVDDRELLEGIRRGDERAFSALFRAYYAALVGMVEGMLRDRALGEDVVQEVMLELWRRRESLAVTDSLRAYLYRAARNRALNQVRRARVEERAEPKLMVDESDVPGADASAGESELEDAIRAAIESLGDGQREVFVLSRTHGLKYTEIADALGISVKTVEARMGKALRVLRERLGGYLSERTGR